jgi:hypothetical protein
VRSEIEIRVTRQRDDLGEKGTVHNSGVVLINLWHQPFSRPADPLFNIVSAARWDECGDYDQGQVPRESAFVVHAREPIPDNEPYPLDVLLVQPNTSDDAIGNQDGAGIRWV